jgi:hypothetical protein
MNLEPCRTPAPCASPAKAFENLSPVPVIHLADQRFERDLFITMFGLGRKLIALKSPDVHQPRPRRL